MYKNFNEYKYKNIFPHTLFLMNKNKIWIKIKNIYIISKRDKYKNWQRHSVLYWIKHVSSFYIGLNMASSCVLLPEPTTKKFVCINSIGSGWIDSYLIRFVSDKKWWIHTWFFFTHHIGSDQVQIRSDWSIKSDQ
jgi:hypothetical protein